jgi:hypothetical protein
MDRRDRLDLLQLDDRADGSCPTGTACSSGAVLQQGQRLPRLRPLATTTATCPSSPPPSSWSASEGPAPSLLRRADE